MRECGVTRTQAVALGVWVLGNLTGQLASDYEDGKAAQLLGKQITELASYWL